MDMQEDVHSSSLETRPRLPLNEVHRKLEDLSRRKATIVRREWQLHTERASFDAQLHTERASFDAQIKQQRQAEDTNLARSYNRILEDEEVSSRLTGTLPIC